MRKKAQNRPYEWTCFSFAFATLLPTFLWAQRTAQGIGSNNHTMAEPVGDFYVYLLQGEDPSPEMISSTKLLTQNNRNKPTVIHFYDGG